MEPWRTGKVIRIEDATYNTKRFWIQVPEIEVFDFKPGQTITDRSFDEDEWQLYNLNDDFNERVDLAKKFPEKLAELKKIFDEQAEKNHLYPLLSWYDVYNKRIHHPNGSDTQALIK